MVERTLSDHVGVHNFSLGQWPLAITESGPMSVLSSVGEYQLFQLAQMIQTRTRASQFFATLRDADTRFHTRSTYQSQVIGEFSRSIIESTSRSPIVWIVQEQEIDPNFNIQFVSDEAHWTTSVTESVAEARFELDLSEIEYD